MVTTGTSIISAVLLLVLLLLNWSSSWEESHRLPSLFRGRKIHVHDHDQCRGRRVYIHQLPAEFNHRIVERACDGRSPWLCDRLSHDGFGLPARFTTFASSDQLGSHQEALDLKVAALVSSCRLLPASSWYRTGQFALELMIHERFRNYQCRTDDPELADLFYIPYYAGLDVSQYLFTSKVHMRDKLGQRLLGFLQGNSHWNRKQGSDHVLVLGRIVWDFGRSEEDGYESWGSSLLSIPELDNATKLLIERDIWKPSQVAVPYPTGFHPSSRQELAEWLAIVNGSSRDVLVSFAGGLREGNSSGSSGAAITRRLLRRQCEEQGSRCTVVRCESINCEENPEVVTCVASRSIFCLMPPGDSPTRKGFFDSLVAGCIPVVFSEHSAHTQYVWHLPRDPASYSIMFPQSGVIDGSIDVLRELAMVPAARVRSMQETIARIIPQIIYANSRSGSSDCSDAFDIALQHLISAAH